MQSDIIQLLVPYTVLSQKRREPFTREMEKAAIFCLAERERKKGGGIFSKQPVEEFAFIAKVCYPFWLIPLGETTLLLDGLNFASHTLTYKNIPDVETFLKNFERSSKTRETYMAFLTEYLNYFRAPESEIENIVDGLIVNPEFLNEFEGYLSNATQVDSPPSEMVVISPTIDEEEVKTIKKELQSLKNRLTEETNLLYKSMKCLNAATGDYIKALRGEIREIEEKLGAELGKKEETVRRKVEEVREKYDTRITKISKDFEKQLYVLQQEKVKLEKKQKQLTDKIEHCEAEIKTAQITKDDVGEEKWKQELKKAKEQLAEVESELKETEKRIKEKESEKKIEIFNIKSECDAEISEIEKDLMEIEASRDAKIQIYKKEMEKLEELTSEIINKIDALVRLREATMVQFEKLGLKQKRRKCVRVHVPFYLACFRMQSEKRYAYFPPVEVNSIDASVKLKGVFGKTKIAQLLRPRSKAFNTLLNKLMILMEKNAVFRRGIDEAGAKLNVLRTKALREKIKEGLEQLRDEGWLSERELKTLRKELA